MCAQYAYHPWCKYIPCCTTRTTAYLRNNLFPGRLPVADFMIDLSLRAYSSSPDFLPRIASMQWPYTIIGVLLRRGSTGAANSREFDLQGCPVESGKIFLYRFQANLRTFGELSRFTSSYCTDRVTKGNNSRNNKKGFRWCSKNATFE